MFFKKKKQEKPFDKEYFLYRDSLTGCMNETFAVKSFKRLKGNENFGGVMVKIRNVENMLLDEGEDLIKETAVIVANIYEGDISRINGGCFVIFTDNFKAVADKINHFLYALSDEKRRYAVGGEGFDPHEGDYNMYMKRLRRAVAAAEFNEGKTAIY